MNWGNLYIIFNHAQLLLLILIIMLLFSLCTNELHVKVRGGESRIDNLINYVDFSFTTILENFLSININPPLFFASCMTLMSFLLVTDTALVHSRQSLSSNPVERRYLKRHAAGNYNALSEETWKSSQLR